MNTKLKSCIIKLLFILGSVILLSSPNIFKASLGTEGLNESLAEFQIDFENGFDVVELEPEIESIKSGFEEEFELENRSEVGVDFEAKVDVLVEEDIELEALPILIDLKLEEIPVVSEYELWEMPNIKAVAVKPLTIGDADTVYRYIHWDEAQNILLRNMEYKVTDVITGESWNMVRLGGVNHADSVTRSIEDTETMLKTFGEWTWEPRAVVVDTFSGYRMPAALRGMPHDIWADWNGNGMDGHVCLYFYGSRTHFSNMELESAQWQIGVAEQFLMATAG